MAAPRLTTVRRALWECIENWAPLQGYFTTRLKFEGSDELAPEELRPGVMRMPFVAISPGAGASPWWLNQEKRIDYGLTVEIGLQHWRLDEAERLWETLLTAFYQYSRPGQTLAELARAQAMHGEMFDSFSISLLTDNNGNKFTYLAIPVTLRQVGFNPAIDAAGV